MGQKIEKSQQIYIGVYSGSYRAAEKNFIEDNNKLFEGKILKKISKLVRETLEQTVDESDKFYNEECRESDINEVIKTMQSVDMFRSLFDGYKKYIFLCPQGSENYMEFSLSSAYNVEKDCTVQRKSDIKAISIKISEVAKIVGIEDKIEFNDISKYTNFDDASSDNPKIGYADITVAFYNDVLVKQDSDHYLLSLSNGPRIVLTTIENALKMLQLFNSKCTYEIKYYFLDTKDPSKLFEIDVQSENENIELLEDLKQFKNNYSLPKQLQNKQGNFYQMIRSFHLALQTANLSSIEKLLVEFYEQNGKEELDDSNAMIKEIINNIWDSLEEFLEIENGFAKLNIEKFLLDLIEKEFYQLAITLLEGKLRDEILGLVMDGNQTIGQDRYNIEKELIMALRFYDKSQSLYTKRVILNCIQETQIQSLCEVKSRIQYFRFNRNSRRNSYDCSEFSVDFQQFMHFRNDLNHGTSAIDTVAYSKSRVAEIEQSFKAQIRNGNKMLTKVRELKDEYRKSNATPN